MPLEIPKELLNNMKQSGGAPQTGSLVIPDELKTGDIKLPEGSEIPPDVLKKARSFWGIKEAGIPFTQMTEGAGLEEPSMRFAASLARDPQEAVDYLNRESKKVGLNYEFALSDSSFGQPAVLFRKSGEALYKPVDAPWNKPSMKELASDVGEVIPGAVELGGAALGGASGGPAGAALAGFGTEALRSTAANALGVTDSQVREGETPTQYMSRLTPNTGDMLKTAVLNAAGEGLGRAVAPAISSFVGKRFPVEAESFLSAAGKPVERPIYPSERLGKFGGGIEYINNMLNSPFAKEAVRKENKIASDILGGSEAYLAKGKTPMSSSELNLALNDSLKSDLAETKAMLNQSYDEIRDAIPDTKINVGDVLAHMRSLDLTPDAQATSKVVQDKLAKSKTIKGLYDTMRELTDYSSGILGGKSLSKNGELGQLRGLLDDSFAQKLSSIPKINDSIPGIGQTGADLAEHYNMIKDMYAEQVEFAKNLAKNLKSETGAYSTIPKMLREKTDILKNMSALPEAGIEMPSETSSELMARGAAKEFGEKYLNQGNVNYGALEKALNRGRETGVLKELLGSSGRQELGDLGQMALPTDFAKQADNYLQSLDVLKQITNSPSSIAARQTVKDVPFSMTESLMKALGNAINATTVVSPLAYRPAQTTAKLGLMGVRPTLDAVWRNSLSGDKQ